MFTLDFFERWMRNFSYCSMAKMRLGIGLVSRRTRAYRTKRRLKFRFKGFQSCPLKQSAAEPFSALREKASLPPSQRQDSSYPGNLRFPAVQSPLRTWMPMKTAPNLSIYNSSCLFHRPAGRTICRNLVASLTGYS